MFGQVSSPGDIEPRPGLPLELRWHAPRECPAASEVRAELERIARTRPGLSLQPLAASAQVQRRGSRYHVTLRTEHEGRRGERTLEASECKTLVRSVTLVLALAFGAGVEIEPHAAAESGAAGPATGAGASARPDTNTASPRTAAELPAATSDSTPGPTRRELDDGALTDGVAARSAVASAPAAAASPSAAAGAPPPATEISDGVEESEAREETDSRRADLSLAWLLGLGGTPNLMPSAGLIASTGPELRLGALSLGLRALFWPGFATDAGPDIQAHWLALGGALQACGHTALLASLELAACGGGRLVAMRAHATGNVRGTATTAPWTALTSAVSLSWPSTSWLRARLELGLALSLGRPRFSIEGLGDTHRVPLLIPDATAAALVTF